MTHETLQPITDWLIPDKYYNIIEHVYQEHTNKNPNTCFICNKSFINSFVRDFHINFYHEITIPYICYHCHKYDTINQEETVFTKT